MWQSSPTGEKMNIIQKTLLVSALGLAAGAAGAHTDTFWVDSAGNAAKDGDGHCLHTINWKSGDDCSAAESVSQPAKTTPAAAPVKAAAPAPVVKQAEPVKTSPAPRYREISLASGASFALGGSTLSPEGKAAVAELLGKFDGETIKQVIVEGHTDDRGDAAFNQDLSEKRANAVKAELIANGVDAKVIQTTGYGEGRPVADNNTREGRAKNRRVEIKIDAAKREF
jgi:OOP family OmpA-OmpF porin